MSRAAKWAAINGGALNQLSLSGPDLVAGKAVVLNITGATAGSTLAATGLPAGWALDSAARTLSGTPVAGMNILVEVTETLAGKANSPRKSVFGIQVAARDTSSHGLPGQDYDVIVVGAKEAGFAAAIGAARQGKKVLLVSENDRVGGVGLGGGVSQFDVKSDKSAYLVSSFGREVGTALANAETADFTFHQWWRAEGKSRPSWGSRQVRQFLSRHPNISLLFDTSLAGVTLDNAGLKATAHLVGIEGRGQTFTCARLIDGSYTGDLQQKAGLTTSLGRESSGVSAVAPFGYGEATAGTLAAGTWSPNVAIDPYVIAGDAASGLLFPLRANPSTTVGAGDGLVQDFGYRLFITSVAADKMAIPAPDKGVYDPLKYELLGRAMVASPTYFADAALGAQRLFQFYDLGTNGGAAMGPTYMTHVDINSLGPISTNYPNADENREYVRAAPARRRQIEANAKQWVLGLFYWLNTDGRVPATLKTAVNAYGFSAKEFVKYGGFPGEFYAREGERVVGDRVLKQTDITSYTNAFALINTSPKTPAIARAFYDIDSHPVQRYWNGAALRTEGAQLLSLGNEAGGYLPWWILLPKATESKVTLHPGNPSVSQVVWRSIRMALVELQMGYAAGIVAALSIDASCGVQDIDTARLDRIIDLDGLFQGLTISPDGASFTRGTITDIAGAGAAWVNNAANRPFFFGNWGMTVATGSTNKKRVRPRIATPGLYQVRMVYMPGGDRASNAKVNISSGGVVTTRTIDMRYQGGGSGAGGDGGDVILGTFYFDKGPTTADLVSADYIELDPTGADGVMSWGGLQLVPVQR